jgi:hypothetical protein
LNFVVFSISSFWRHYELQYTALAVVDAVVEALLVQLATRTTSKLAVLTSSQLARGLLLRRSPASRRGASATVCPMEG